MVSFCLIFIPVLMICILLQVIFKQKKKKKETEGFYRLFLPFLKHSGKMNARLMIS